MDEYLVLKSNNNINKLYNFCKMELFKRYRVTNALELKRNKLRINKKYLELTLEVIASYIVNEFIYNVVDDALCICCEIFNKQIKSFKKDIHKLCDEVKNIFIVFFSKFNTISYEGILLFALKDIRQEMEDIAEKIINKLETEEDIEDFKNLLRLYIQTEQARFDDINIVIQPDCSYKYFDRNKIDISRKCMVEFYREFYDNNALDDDMLLSLLVLKLPKNIFIHGKIIKEKRCFFETLSSIFGNRLLFCNTRKCPFCSM